MVLRLNARKPGAVLSIIVTQLLNSERHTCSRGTNSKAAARCRISYLCSSAINRAATALGPAPCTAIISRHNVHKLAAEPTET